MAEPRKASRRDLVEEFLVVLIMAVCLAAYAWDVRGIPDREMNMMVMDPVLVLSALLLAFIAVRYLALPLLRRTVDARAGEAGEEAGDEAGDGAVPGGHRSMLLVTGALVAYAAVFTLAPFVLTTTLFVAACLVGLGLRGPVYVSVVSVGTAAALYLVGVHVLGVALP